MNNEELAEFAKVQTAARNLADAIATGDQAKWTSVKEFNFATAYNIIYNIAMRPLPSSSMQANLYGTGEDLYLRFQQLLAELVRRHPINPSLPTEMLFRAVIAKWNQFQFIEKWMLKAFQYISRFYVPHLSKPPLSFLSLVIFNQEVFKRYESTVNSVLLSDIRKMRCGETVDQERMKDAVRLLLKMGFGDRMSPDFVKALLSSTAEYYMEESKRCVASDSVVEYTRRVHAWLISEATLASWVLPDHAMQQEFLGEVEREAIAEHAPFILDTPDGGFISLLRQSRMNDLKFLLQIMLRPKANGINHMASLLKRECLSEGEGLVARYCSPTLDQGEPDAKSYVGEFIALHEKYMELVSTCLTHSSFSLAIKEAFETTVNMGVTLGGGGEQNNSSNKNNSDQQQQQQLVIRISTSALIARYSDMLMRGGPQFHMTDAELEATVSKIVSLFTRIHDKDDFFDCIRGTLSKRLLSTGASNDDRERMFLSRFRAKCGASATNKLEGMLHDVDASRALLESYANSSERAALVAASPSTGEVDFAPLLLTQAFWPTMPAETLNVPRPIQDHMDAFFKHYCVGRHHRQLTWVYSFGQAVVAVVGVGASASQSQSSSQSSCELLVNVYQAAVIMQYNERTQWRVKDLVAATGLPIEEVSRHVHSFAASRVQLLTIFDAAPSNVGGDDDDAANNSAATTPSTGPIKIPLDENQVIRLSDTFNPQSRKVRVPALVPKTNLAAAAAAGGAGMSMVTTGSAGGGGGMMMGASSVSGGMMTPSASSTMGGGAGGGAEAAAADAKMTERQRTPTVEATIMKVMKSRQRMEHQALISGVMDHLHQRFKPDPKFIKTCIESLLHRDLISRDAADPNTYVFMTT